MEFTTFQDMTRPGYVQYEHINTNNEIKTGKCNSTPKILKDGRIELSEKWEWTNGEKSKGESKIIELK
jgi:hypothetical protein